MMAQMFGARPGLWDDSDAILPQQNWSNEDDENHFCSGLRCPFALMSRGYPMLSNCRQCMPSTIRKSVPTRRTGAERRVAPKWVLACN
eukprot:448331-Pleurochrysis_carterae.AAC.1